MAEVMHVNMTTKARDALIAIAILWVVFAAVVFLRLVGRLRGAGIGPDDVLSCVALVCQQEINRVLGEMLLMISSGTIVLNNRDVCCW